MRRRATAEPAHLRKRGVKVVIPEKRDQAADRAKKGRRGGRPVATRDDKTPESYLAGLHLRASMIWIRDLTQTTS
ncbi:hypothetical protein SNA_18640 [Streptomyces natalensis ATCC 27448]|uniref:Transposase n=1 Tax=Streptomyces natalensis ATCC 27448 TaxID=1240678 RepID=A0A0D7CNI0_9ACTN|nr:hypothetical protein SNA_18640 [Streptomyces natalensis ATCC 27448]